MGNGNKVEMLIAICAVVTSAIAVFIAWDQGRVMRAQQHGSVYPVLQMDGFVSDNEGGKSMGLTFSNSGVGPALIESIVIRADGEVVESLQPYRERLPEGSDISWQRMVGRAIAAGAQVDALVVSFRGEGFTREQLYATAGEWSALTFETCYCSVFKRCWKVTDNASVSAERVKTCKRDEQDIFEGLSSRAAAEPQNSSEVE